MSTTVKIGALAVVVVASAGACQPGTPAAELEPLRGKADSVAAAAVPDEEAEYRWMERTSHSGTTTITRLDRAGQTEVQTDVLLFDPRRRTTMTLSVEPSSVGARAPALRFRIFYKKSSCGCDDWHEVAWVTDESYELPPAAQQQDCPASYGPGSTVSAAFRSISTGRPDKDQLTVEIGLPCGDVVDERVLDLGALPGVGSPDRNEYAVFVFPIDTADRRAEAGVAYGYTFRASCDGKPCL